MVFPTDNKLRISKFFSEHRLCKNYIHWAFFTDRGRCKGLVLSASTSQSWQKTTGSFRGSNNWAIRLNRKAMLLGYIHDRINLVFDLRAKIIRFLLKYPKKNVKECGKERAVGRKW